jgi:phosphoglucosamine mutase
MKFIRTQVGDRYIVEHMRKEGSLFGGEPSGHLVFKKYSTTGDGTLAALKVIESIRFYDKKLSDLAAEIELFPQVMQNVHVAKKTPFEQVPEIVAALKEAEAKLAGTGRILLRYSGTEPLVRVMVEGKNEKQVNDVCSKLAEIVEKCLG